MIAAVRNEYKGPVLYFPNQSNFPELDMGYWQLFDAIGLTFWGSLLNNAVPTVSDLANAWEPYQGMILNKATATNKKIFFGEIGYPSREFCADDPFACNKDGSVYNADCQDNAYQAFYQVWGKSSQVMGALFWQIGLGEKGYDKSMCSEDSIGCCPMKQSTQETIDEWM
jgi:hypothetical protein